MSMPTAGPASAPAFPSTFTTESQPTTTGLEGNNNLVGKPEEPPSMPISTEVMSPLATPQPIAPSPDENEPKNALTALFSGTEWIAMKELRNSLPEILAESYPDKPGAKTTPICLWGVTINPVNPKDARVSVVLMKFLRARNCNVRCAHEMMVATLRWRDQFNVEAAVKEEFPDEVFGTLGYVSGHDKEGRPVVYNLYGANKAAFSDVQRFLRWRIALMEKCVSLLDFETVDQMVQIHDYEGVSLRNQDANSKNAASEATSILQNHYPEFLHRKFFVHVPAVLDWMYWIFKPLISANTLAKMSVVGSGHHAIRKALLPIIDVQQLPKRYGGKGADF